MVTTVIKSDVILFMIIFQYELYVHMIDCWLIKFINNLL